MCQADSRSGSAEPIRLSCDRVPATVKHDFREAARFLVANPGFSLVVVLTLGLAVGINSTIFSVLNGVLLRPLGNVIYVVPPYVITPDELHYVHDVIRESLELADCARS